MITLVPGLKPGTGLHARTCGSSACEARLREGCACENPSDTIRCTTCGMPTRKALGLAPRPNEVPPTRKEVDSPRKLSTCEVCGSAVRVVTSGEGTSHYEPVESQRTQEAKHAHDADLKEVLDVLEELASADPDMGSWSDTQKRVDEVLAKHGRST